MVQAVEFIMYLNVGYICRKLICLRLNHLFFIYLTVLADEIQHIALAKIVLADEI